MRVSSTDDPRASATIDVRLQFSSGATLGGTTLVSPTGGRATFTDLTVDLSGRYRLQASSAAPGVLDSVAFPTTQDFVVGAVGEPVALRFVGATEASVPERQLFPFAPQVAIVDAYGNVVSTASASVTIDLGFVTNGATLSGGVTRSTTAGVASFPGPSVDRSEQYYLNASAQVGGTFVFSLAPFFLTIEGWVPIEGGLDGGTIHSLSLDPSAPSTLYAATTGGVVFKTIDAGDTWSVADVNYFSPSATTISTHRA